MNPIRGRTTTRPAAPRAPRWIAAAALAAGLAAGVAAPVRADGCTISHATQDPLPGYPIFGAVGTGTVHAASGTAQLKGSAVAYSNVMDPPASYGGAADATGHADCMRMDTLTATGCSFIFFGTYRFNLWGNASAKTALEGDSSSGDFNAYGRDDAQHEHLIESSIIRTSGEGPGESHASGNTMGDEYSVTAVTICVSMAPFTFNGHVHGHGHKDGGGSGSGASGLDWSLVTFTYQALRCN